MPDLYEFAEDIYKKVTLKKITPIDRLPLPNDIYVYCFLPYLKFEERCLLNRITPTPLDPDAELLEKFEIYKKWENNFQQGRGAIRYELTKIYVPVAVFMFAMIYIIGRHFDSNTFITMGVASILLHSSMMLCLCSDRTLQKADSGHALGKKFFDYVKEFNDSYPSEAIYLDRNTTIGEVTEQMELKAERIRFFVNHHVKPDPKLSLTELKSRN